MADSREDFVWTNHAEQQWEENKTGHDFSGGNKLRDWMKGLDNVSKVVDLGCGGSLWRKMFLDFDYLGIDQNENMISYAKKRFPDSNYLVSNAENTPLEDGSVDLVFTSAVLQHNLHERKADVVKEIYRILRPGGYYMCTENTLRKDNFMYAFPNVLAWDDAMDDGYSFTPNGWERFMSGFGFKLVKFDEPSEYLYQKE